MTEFKNKVVLITGAATGLGQVCASAFALAGAKVIVDDILKEEGIKTVEAIRRLGGEAVFFHGDVRDEKQVKDLIDFTVKTYGRLDCAVNNAGFEQNTPLTEETEEHYLQTFDTNVKGIYYCMKHEICQMLKNGGGAIVNQASITSNITGTPTEGLYGASKGAVIGMTKSVAPEVASQGISINCIAACGIDTPGNMFNRYMKNQKVAIEAMRNSFPIKRFGTGEELAHAVMFLCSEKSRFIIGATLVVDGGFTIV